MTDTIGFELSTQQQAAWRRHTAGTARPSVCVLELSSTLDPATLREQLANAMRRHEVLRTTFSRPPGRRFPVQVIAEVASALALEERPRTSGPDRLAELEAELLATTFDVEHGPLVRVVLGADRGKSALGIAADALVLDADGVLALGLELVGADTDAEPLQYSDYAAWQAELLEESPPVVATAGRPTAVALPLAGAGEQSEAVTLPLEPDIVSLLSGLAADPRDAWLAAWVTAIARLTGRDDIELSVAASRRASDELDGAVGVYARSVPIAVELDSRTTFAGLVAAVAAVRSAADSDQELLGALAEELPLAFSYRSASVAAPELPVAGVHQALAVPTGQARLEVVAQDGGATMSLLSTGLDRVQAERVARTVERVARSAGAAPDRGVWELDVISPQERQALVDEFGTGPERPPAALLHDRFAQSAAEHPDSVAVTAGGAQLTYAELLQRSDAIAAALRGRQVGGGVVALLLDRSPDAIAALLGVLKAGAAYLPLNPDQPGARLAFQVGDSGATLILTDATLASAAAALGTEILDVAEIPDVADAGIAAGAGAQPATPAGGDDIAYLIYTSGSTGVPKGVEVTHANLANYVDGVSARLGIDGNPEPLRFGLVTTLSTDLGNTSVFPALASGGCVDLVPADAVMDGAAFAAYVAEHPIDILKITPSHLSALLASGDPMVLPRQRLVLGGEAAPWSLIEAVRLLSDVPIVNHYGPTETTVGSVASEVRDRVGAQAASGTVPIGRPLANTTVTVVDERLALVPLGAPGELLIGGAGVARGYRNQPEQTAERFVVDPQRGAPHRVYRTGDRVRMLADGSLEFLHRVDGQLKVRGYRVEVAEIEAVLREHATVGQAAVVPREHAAGEMRLVAYVVPALGSDVSGDVLRDLARDRLPDYMVPAAVVVLPALPLMPNGKLDRAALPEPEEAAVSTEYAPPSTATEQGIADIWAEALGAERVGVNDDFFELGGHSLLATQVIARIRSAFGVQLPLHALFTAPRVGDLAREVEAMSGSEDAELQDLLTELEGLSDEEAERLLDAD